MSRNYCGRLFHAFELATEEALKPIRVPVRGTSYNPRVAEGTDFKFRRRSDHVRDVFRYYDGVHDDTRVYASHSVLKTHAFSLFRGVKQSMVHVRFASPCQPIFNSLPQDIRSCDSISTFCRLLKSFYFRDAFV